MTCSAMTHHCSVVSSPSIGFQCGNWSGDLFGYEPHVSGLVVHFLVVSVDIGVSGSGPGCQSGYRSGDPLKLWHPNVGGQWFRS